MMKGDDIKRLIPQRDPFIMVHEFAQGNDDETGCTARAVQPDNYFVLPDSTLAETGLMEHIAQSCSALAGWKALDRQAERPPVGLIGEVKRFECLRRPKVGETVRTTVHFGFSFGGATLATGECQVDGETIATAQLKIFIQ